MLLNFCDPCLTPTFSCLQPCHEGYDVNNLASTSYSDRQKGFLAYGFPPVTVTVAFMCSVNIRHVIIWPQVRSQKSLGIEILVRSAAKQKQTWQSCSSSLHHVPSTTFVGQDDSFHRIGSILLNSTDIGVVFSKHDFKSSESPQPKFVQKSLFLHYALDNADSIQIKIFKTASSAPALGKVEVWGDTGSFSLKISRIISKLWSNCHQTKSIIPPENAPTSADISIERVAEDTEASEGLVPEEFLDSLTCNIMSLPYILPSGKTVDNLTLEKHQTFEAMYGRAPSDPFTGITFTENCRPVPDNDLKRRIDSFLVANSHRHDLRNVPRTTGTIVRCSATASIKTSTQFNHLIGALSCAEDRVQDSSSSSCGLAMQAPMSTLRTMKRQVETVVNENDLLKKVKGIDVPVSSCLTSSALKYKTAFAANESNYGFPVSVSKKEVCSKTHNERLEESLQSVIKSALSGKPTYVDFNSSRPKPTPIQLKPPSCVNCIKSEVLYALPCNHLLCRKCLVLRKDSKLTDCPKCQTTYESCNVMRFHS